MKLEPGEVICDKCNGVGHFGYTIEVNEYSDYAGYVHRVPGHKTYDYCPKCHGSGKLDWVEVVVGKNLCDIWFPPPPGFKRG
mgnify:CR=1 FL=1